MPSSAVASFSSAAASATVAGHRILVSFSFTHSFSAFTTAAASPLTLCCSALSAAEAPPRSSRCLEAPSLRRGLLSDCSQPCYPSIPAEMTRGRNSLVRVGKGNAAVALSLVGYDQELQKLGAPYPNLYKH